MAFVKKTAKTPASYTKAVPAKGLAKGPANYARKKAEEELEVEGVEEIEETDGADHDEVQDEVRDDYEETNTHTAHSAGPRGGGFRAPNAGHTRETGKALRLTGLFAGKREGCFSGKLRPEDAANLADLIQEAQSTNQQIVFFLWENQGNPQFSLTANISAPAQKKSWGNRGGNGGGQGWNRGGQGQGGNFNRGFRRY